MKMNDMDKADDSAGPPGFDTDSTAPEMLRATPSGRRLAGTLIALLIIGLAGFGMFILPSLQAAFSPLPSLQSITMIKAGFTILALIVTLLAAALAATGWRIVGSGQTPPPGALLWRDTRIARGAPARRTGIAYCVAGVLCCAIGIGLGVTSWILLERLAEAQTIRLPPGVTILKQAAPEAR